MPVKFKPTDETYRWIKQEDSARLSELSEVSENREGPPNRFKILGYGRHQLTQNGLRSELDFTKKVADQIVAEAERRGLDIPIDYEHESFDQAEEQGIEEMDLGEIPAIGWMTMTSEPDGLYANIKTWSDKAMTYLKDRAYKYFSPVIRGLQDGNYRLSSLALTNTPALDKQEALVAKSETIQHKGINMEFIGKLANILGIEKDAIALTETGEVSSDTEAKMLGKIAALIKLAEDNPDAAVLQAENQELKTALEKRERDELIAKGRQEGKLSDAMITGPLASFSAAALSSFLEALPINSVVPLQDKVNINELPTVDSAIETDREKISRLTDVSSEKKRN